MFVNQSYLDDEVNSAVNNMVLRTCSDRTTKSLSRLTYHSALKQRSLSALQLVQCRGLCSVDEFRLEEEGEDEPLSPLMFAARIKFVEGVAFLLQQGHANVDLVSPHTNRTALMISLSSSPVDVDVVTLLLTHGSPVVSKDQQNRTALHYCLGSPDIVCGSQEVLGRIIGTLVRCGSDVMAPNADGQVPLHTLALNRGQHLPFVPLQESVLQLLLPKECLPPPQDRYGKTPLHYAARFGDVDLVRAILAHSPTMTEVKDNFLRLPLHKASTAAVAKELLAVVVPAKVQEVTPSPSPDDEVSPPDEVKVDVDTPSPPVMIVLLQPDQHGQTPLHHAAYHGFDDLLSFYLKYYDFPLIDFTGPLDKHKKHPVFVAAENGKLGALKLLVEAMCPTTTSSSSTSSNSAFAQLLARPDDYGAPVSHAVARNGHHEVMKYLLSLDPMCCTHMSSPGAMTPLHIAALQGDTLMCSILIAGIGPTAGLPSPKKKGNPPPSSTNETTDSEENSAKPPSIPITPSARVNSKNALYQTPLHLACAGGHASVFRMLVDPQYFGSSTDLWEYTRLKDTQRKTAYELLGSTTPVNATTITLIDESLAVIESQMQQHQKKLEDARKKKEREMQKQMEAEQKRIADHIALLADEAVNDIKRVFPYDQLKMPGGLTDQQICVQRREDYLSEEEFELVFGLKREVFRKWADKKREAKKGQLSLQPY